MKLLIDMNLSPIWVSALAEGGWEAVHWFKVGDPKAPDHEIMQWAKKNHYVIFTHDLDFGAILAASQADCPSVIQVRTQDVHPDSLKNMVCKTLREFQDYLEKGALISMDEESARVRILPIGSSGEI